MSVYQPSVRANPSQDTLTSEPAGGPSCVEAVYVEHGLNKVHLCEEVEILRHRDDTCSLSVLERAQTACAAQWKAKHSLPVQ